MCSLSIEQSILSRETIQNALLSELCPFFDTFYPLSSTPQLSVGTHMPCCCLFISIASTFIFFHLILLTSFEEKCGKKKKLPTEFENIHVKNRGNHIN